MNNELLIREALLYKNLENHEQSECKILTEGEEVKGCVWVDSGKICEMERAMLPVYQTEDGKTMFADFAHATVIGSTGTGKSEVIIKNTIRAFAEMKDEIKPSFVAADLKGDISRGLYKTLREGGYKILIFDMKRPYQSARYNFMTQIYDDYREACKIKRMLDNFNIAKSFDGVEYSSAEEARLAANAKYLTLTDNVEEAISEIVNIIIVCDDPKNTSWFQGARNMLSAIIMTMLHDTENEKCGMTRENFTISNACRIAFHTDDDCDELVDWLKRAEDKLVVKNAITGNYKINAKVTRDGYISTLNTALGSYVSNAVGALTQTSDDICLRDIAERREPYAIFLITDDRRKVTNSIAMTFINDLVTELTRYADNSNVREMSRDFVFLLDEFANMPPMPNMSNKITTLRSRRIWMIMAIQSIQQLKQVYGDEVAEIIRDNCDLSIFLGSNNRNTKEIFSASMGQRAGITTSYQKSNDGGTSEHVTTANIPVVRISDLDALSLGQFYIASRTFVNLLSYMSPYFKRHNPDDEREYKEGAFRHFAQSENIYRIDEVLRKENEEDISGGAGRRKFNFNF